MKKYNTYSPYSTYKHIFIGVKVTHVIVDYFRIIAIENSPINMYSLK